MVNKDKPKVNEIGSNVDVQILGRLLIICNYKLKFFEAWTSLNVDCF